MGTLVPRQPLKNFFLKKSMQISIIFKILCIVFLTSALTTGILSYIYNNKSQEGNFYFMSNDIMQDLELTNILGLILPALITAQLVTLIIVFFVGMFSSRKAAVPVYKLEKWATQITQGNLKTHLGFRETTAMNDLTIQCNALATTYRKIFIDIEQSLLKIQSEKYTTSPVIITEVAKIETILRTLQFRD